jgi:dolichol-phosphate mannosyltransferase
MGDKDGSDSEKVLTACIVIPTYNEAGNIELLLDRIFENGRRQRGTQRWRLSVLVVDDNSPDRTAIRVSEYRTKNPDVHLLLRKEKQGLGAAYIAGMRHAMAFLNPDVIMEMDADFSHNPDDVLRLLAEIQNGADFVIGSRYVKGGSIPPAWGLHRRLLSKAANLYTKAVLRIPRVRDCSGGFRAIRTSALRQVDLSSLNVKGYAFQVLLLEVAVRNGALVREVPIAFSERNAGKSKMRFADMAEGGALLLRVGTQRLFTPQRIPAMTPAATAGTSGGTGTLSATVEEQPIKARMES